MRFYRVGHYNCIVIDGKIIMKFDGLQCIIPYDPPKFTEGSELPDFDWNNIIAPFIEILNEPMYLTDGTLCGEDSCIFSTKSSYHISKLKNIKSLKVKDEIMPLPTSTPPSVDFAKKLLKPIHIKVYNKYVTVLAHGSRAIAEVQGSTVIVYRTELLGTDAMDNSEWTYHGWMSQYIYPINFDELNVFESYNSGHMVHSKSHKVSWDKERILLKKENRGTNYSDSLKSRLDWENVKSELRSNLIL